MQLPIPECYESAEDALRSAVQALGGNKKVGPRMRPDFAHADEWLRKCLSDDRRERLDPGQVQWILREARKVGFHAAFDYFASDAGYKATPVDAEEQIKGLQESIEAGLRQLNERMAQMARLQERVSGK